MNENAVRVKDKDRERIAKAAERFLAEGGEVRQIDPSVFAERLCQEGKTKGRGFNPGRRDE